MKRDGLPVQLQESEPPALVNGVRTTVTAVPMFVTLEVVVVPVSVTTPAFVVVAPEILPATETVVPLPIFAAS